MPEGDALHRAAARLQPLVGERIEAESPHPRGEATGVARVVDGRVLEQVEAVGKHLLLQRAEFACHIVERTARLFEILRQTERATGGAEGNDFLDLLEEFGVGDRPADDDIGVAADNLAPGGRVILGEVLQGLAELVFECLANQLEVLVLVDALTAGSRLKQRAFDDATNEPGPGGQQVAIVLIEVVRGKAACVVNGANDFFAVRSEGICNFRVAFGGDASVAEIMAAGRFVAFDNGSHEKIGGDWLRAWPGVRQGGRRRRVSEPDQVAIGIR